nr:hypothetical protein [Herbidospora cretacea]
MKLKLDLHDIFNKGDQIDRALRGIIQEAIERRRPRSRSSPGRGRAS